MDRVSLAAASFCCVPAMPAASFIRSNPSLALTAARFLKSGTNRERMSIRSYMSGTVNIPTDVQPARAGRSDRMKELMAEDPWSIKPIRRSDFQCSFRAQQHPAHYAVAAVCQPCQPWLVSLAESLAPGEPGSAAARAYVDFSVDCIQLPLLSGLGYPSPATPPERLIQNVKLLSYVTLVDDADDNPSLLGSDVQGSKQRHAEIKTVLAGGAPSGKGHLALLAELWQELARAGMVPRVQELWAASYIDAMDASDAQAAFRQVHGLPTDLAEFQAYRRPASLYAPAFVLLEHAMGIELDDTTRALPIVRQLYTAALDYSILVNDLASFRAEMSEGDFYNFPCFFFYRSTDPAYAIADGVEDCFRMLREADSLCVKLIAEMEDSGLLREKPGLRDFVSSLGTWSAGFLEWCLITARYRASRQ